MSNNLLMPTVAVIILSATFILGFTAPIWLPHLLGIKIKRCEYEIKSVNGNLISYCKCYYK